MFSSRAVCFSLVQVGRITCVSVSVHGGVAALYPVPTCFHSRVKGRGGASASHLNLAAASP
jgi:hypothetical protein